MIDIKKTGVLLRAICRKNHITVQDIQEFAHISSNQAVYSWFNGRSLPSVDNFYALSKMTGIPMDKMIIEKKNENPGFLKKYLQDHPQTYYHAEVDSIVVRLSRYAFWIARGRK